MQAISTHVDRYLWVGLLLVMSIGPAWAQDGLIGYWPLDEAEGTVAADVSGTGNDGALRADVQWQPDGGNVGGALLWGSVDATSGIEIATTDMSYLRGTVMLWGNMTEPQPARTKYFLGHTTQPSYANRIQLYMDSGNTMLDLGLGDSHTRQTDILTLPTETWLHLALTWDTGDYVIYLDGEEIASGSYAGMTTLGDFMDIGNDGSLSQRTEAFDGLLDEVKFFDRALEPAEIRRAMLGRVELAANPEPAIGATDIAPDVTLGWTAGKFAAQHDVYLGTEFHDVNRATTASEEYMGRQAETSYDPEALILGQTYFWRIDEVNSAPDNTVFKGDVWNFTVEPVSYPIPVGAVTATASSTDPTADPGSTVDGSGLDEMDQHSTDTAHMWLSDPADMDAWIQFELEKQEKLDRVQIWNHNSQTEAILGFGTKEALIETSVDGETWTDMGLVEIAQAPGSSSYTGTSLELGGMVAKYLKMTPQNNWSILPAITQVGLSEVRFYAIPVQAREPEPADGSTTEGVDITLQWRAGREAVEHEVVFSDDEQAVIDGSAVVATVSASAHDLGTLVLNTPYFWKINEMNDLGTPPAYEGNVWTFLTPDHLMIDDFEMYTAKEGQRIWEYWLDGFENQAENGAIVGNGDNAEKGVVYEGSQSMPIAYNNTLAPRSEVVRFFDTPVDLTKGQAEILRLQVIGDPNNGAAPMYVVLADTAGKEVTIDHPDPAATALTDWDEWTIPLGDLGAVNATRIDSITVGVGSSGVRGTIYIDAIRSAVLEP
jgi:hypothetical protein